MNSITIMEIKMRFQFDKKKPFQYINNHYEKKKIENPLIKL